MSSTLEKVEKAEELKAEGNELFRKGDHQGAVAKYAFGYMYVKGLGDTAGGLTGMGGGAGADSLSPEERARVDAASTSIQLNQAACYLKLQKWQKAVAVCSRVLQVQGDNVKALLRRGQAHLGMRDTDRAEEDLRRADSLQPNDRAIRQQLQLLQQEKKRQNEGHAMKGLFT